MKFYSEPHMLVRPKQNGRFKRLRPFRFDENGVYETDSPLMIKALSRRFKSDLEAIKVTEETEVIEEIEEEKEMSYQELKSYAKTLGINTYGMKREQIEESIKGVK